jgi:hypothetical protein
MVAQLSRTTDKLSLAADKLAEAAAWLSAAAEHSIKVLRRRTSPDLMQFHSGRPKRPIPRGSRALIKNSQPRGAAVFAAEPDLP